MHSVAVLELYAKHAGKLGLEWITGHAGKGRLIQSVEAASAVETSDATRNGAGISPNYSLVGHLNLVHPNEVQVLGCTETQYLNDLRDISRKDAIKQLLDYEPACVIVGETQEIPPLLMEQCELTNTPLFASHLPSNKLTEDLHYYLTAMLAEVVILHGVYMEIFTIGVLLTGGSGVGKSELALELLNRGHRLIADDAPEFTRITPDTVNGTCPPALVDFLEVRGLGILNVRELFGASAIKNHKYLKLIISLERMNQDQIATINRVEGSYTTRDVLGVPISEITLPVAPGRNLAVMAECAVQNHILRMGGYISSEDFVQRQSRLISKDTKF